MLEFRNAKQKIGESCQEFEERLSVLAHRAYPDGKRDQIDREIALSFVCGLLDHEASFYLATTCTDGSMFEVWEKMSGYECGKRIIQQKEDTGMGSTGRKQLENTSNRLEKLETNFSLMSHKVVLQNEEIF